jgi:hypothetical protein
MVPLSWQERNRGKIYKKGIEKISIRFSAARITDNRPETSGNEAERPGAQAFQLPAGPREKDSDRPWAPSGPSAHGPGPQTG